MSVGNCLFYSLSDQLYGYPDYHEDIRQRLVAHVRDRANYFMQFVSDVGGERRAPRRAAAAAVQARQSNNVGRIATDEGQRAKFEQMLSQMGKTGFWGGSVELQAFCQAYGKDVIVYADHGVQSFTSDFSCDRREERQTVHVAYHVSYGLIFFLLSNSLHLLTIFRTVLRTLLIRSKRRWATYGVSEAAKRPWQKSLWPRETSRQFYRPGQFYRRGAV